jgi:hypothetical protein
LARVLATKGDAFIDDVRRWQFNDLLVGFTLMQQSTHVTSDDVAGAAKAYWRGADVVERACGQAGR